METLVYEITFNHPEYSPLDAMPMGMNQRHVEAFSRERAVDVFRETYPKFKESEVEGIKKTSYKSLEEWIKDFFPEERERAQKINQRGYVPFQRKIISPDTSKSDPDSRSKLPSYKGIKSSEKILGRMNLLNWFIIIGKK